VTIPAAPFAAAFDQDPGADAGVAREGDTVDCGTLVFTASTPPAPPATVLTYTPPGGGLPTVLTLGGVMVTPPTATVALRGVIDSASEQVFLRGPLELL